jgi:hypothetical protein
VGHDCGSDAARHGSLSLLTFTLQHQRATVFTSLLCLVPDCNDR